MFPAVTSRTDNDGSVTNFLYDGANQLTSEVRTGPNPYSVAYLYDNNGNRTRKTLNGVAENYVYGANDRIQSAGSRTYTTDNNGNITGVTVGGQTTALTWNYENKLTRIDYPGGAFNTFKYNGLGLRVQKVDSSGTQNYVTDGTEVASPVLADTSATYTPGISERRSGTSKFYHGDSLGSTRGITNTGQSATDGILYDAFGLVISRTGTTPTPFGFVGREQYQTDADSGLLLLGHRYYDPYTGRFISQDPIADGDNWYAYVQNNPLTGIDPEGLLRARGGQGGAADETDDKKHTKNARPSTEDIHEQGVRRKKIDAGGEKGDARRLNPGEKKHKTQDERRGPPDRRAPWSLKDGGRRGGRGDRRLPPNRGIESRKGGGGRASIAIEVLLWIWDDTVNHKYPSPWEETWRRSREHMDRYGKSPWVDPNSR